MPISKSAKKALRVATTKTLINRRRKATLKAALKAVTAETLPHTVSLIDKSAKWGILAPNKADRMKSQLGKRIAVTSQPKKAEAKPKTATKKPAAKKPAAKAVKKTK